MISFESLSFVDDPSSCFENSNSMNNLEPENNGFGENSMQRMSF
jgi:hypothetical protein